MKVGPDIARVAALIGDPARANMLAALIGGKALTASELAGEAGITPQTASAHLAKLAAGGLVTVEKQGRHRYVRLTGADVAEMLERLMGLAARAGHLRTRTGPRDPALRSARVCYDHLAGTLGVRLLDGLIRRGAVVARGEGLRLTPAGARMMDAFGIDSAALDAARRPVCKSCLDWSERRHHLAGALGAALLARFYALRWARRAPDSRVVRFTPRGLAAFHALVGADAGP